MTIAAQESPTFESTHQANDFESHDALDFDPNSLSARSSNLVVWAGAVGLFAAGLAVQYQRHIQH